MTTIIVTIWLAPMFVACVIETSDRIRDYRKARRG